MKAINIVYIGGILNVNHVRLSTWKIVIGEFKCSKEQQFQNNLCLNIAWFQRAKNFTFIIGLNHFKYQIA